MFSSIYLTHLRHNEFIQFMKNFLEILNVNDLEVLKLKQETENLSALISTMFALYKPDQGSQITKILQEDDGRRDKALVGIQSVINAYTNHYDEASQQAAMALLKSLKKFGAGITKQNYQAETATITALIEEWKRETVLVNALNKLSLNEWLAELVTANIQFNTHYLDRIKEDSEAPEVKIVSLRKDIIQCYRVLIKRVEAFATISEVDTYPHIIKQTNSLIENYNALVNARTSKEENEEIPTES